MLRNWLLGLAVLLLAGGASVHAQDGEVIVKGKEKGIKGKITSESPKEIVLNKKDAIPAADIVDVYYESEPLQVRLGNVKPGREAEKKSLNPDEPTRKALVAEAIKKYEEALPLVTDAYSKRHLEYKIAMLRARQAQEDGDSPAKAIKLLQDFARKPTNKKGWQINSALETLGALQRDSGDFAGAAETYAKIAEQDSLPEDVRQDAALQAIQVQIAAGKVDEARDKLAELQKQLPKGSRFFARAKVAEAECLVADSQKYADKDDPAKLKLFAQAVELVKGVIKESNDKYVKAVGHNTLGYCLVQQGQAKDAVWEFLWVDVVYNQDRTQHAKALYYLWDIFTKEGDAPRAQEFRELLMSPQFNGTEYRRRLDKEGK